MTENPARPIEHRHAAITLSAPLGQQMVVGKSCAQLRRMVGGLPAKHELAWSARQRQFDIFAEVVTLPQRQRLKVRAIVGKPGYEGVLNP